MKYIYNPPSASILMNSLRSIGYTFEAAIADIIDNSLSAKAKNIWLEYPPTSENIYIAILDDGIGMGQTTLLEAMKYGSKHISEDRKETDLGRFGMGLKSASLSQCKVLTVFSKTSDDIYGLQWNIEYVEKNDEWNVIIASIKDFEHISLTSKLKSLKTGTLVIWQMFDTFEDLTEEVAYDELSKKVISTNNHLSLVFHNFLSGINVKKVAIYTNNNPLIALDPFLADHNKVDKRKPVVIPILDNGREHKVKATPYILPHNKDLTNKDIEKLGGISQLSKNQGFYIYRANRLLVWGTWFGIETKQELYRYARIRLDIPNTMDHLWKIDIKKQSATLPLRIRRQLISTITSIVGTSEKKNIHRGMIKKTGKLNLWERLETRDKNYVYQVNRNSYVMEKLRKEVDEAQFNTFMRFLELMEASIPYHSIYNDFAKNQVNDTLPNDMIDSVALYGIYIINNLSYKDDEEYQKTIDNLLKEYPFNNPKVVEQIKERLKK